MSRSRSWLAIAASLIVLLPLGALVVLWVGASASLDWRYTHSAQTSVLPTVHAPSASLIRIPAGEHVFRARRAGVGGSRGNLILLHGFAESSAMWQPLIERAAGAGYRVVAFDQRGYSPGARPQGTHNYTVESLAKDVRQVAEAVGFDTFHLVGQGWGARAGWRLLHTDPNRVVTWTALSNPHPAAFAKALNDDPDQRSRARYAELLKIPWLPEQILAFNNFEILRNTLWAQYGAQQIGEYEAILAEPGALRAAANWFRAPAAPPSAPLSEATPLTPALLIWGTQDALLAPSTMLAHRALSQAAAWKELELDGGNRLLSSHAPLVTAAILEHLAIANR